MALGVTILAAATANTTNNAASHTGTAGTPASGDLLIAIIQASGNTVRGTMAGGGWTWNFLTSFVKNSSADTTYIFYANATAATSTTPVYTISGNSTGSAMCVIRCTGLDGQAQPYVRQWNSAIGTTANPSVTLPAVSLTANGLIGIAMNTTNSAAQWTMPTGWTAEIAEVTYATPAASLQVCYRASGGTLATYAWTNANTTAWGVFVMELYVAGTGIIEEGSAGTGYSSALSSI